MNVHVLFICMNIKQFNVEIKIIYYFIHLCVMCRFIYILINNKLMQMYLVNK